MKNSILEMKNKTKTINKYRCIVEKLFNIYQKGCFSLEILQIRCTYLWGFLSDSFFDE